MKNLEGIETEAVLEFLRGALQNVKTLSGVTIVLRVPRDSSKIKGEITYELEPMNVSEK